MECPGRCSLLSYLSQRALVLIMWPRRRTLVAEATLTFTIRLSNALEASSSNACYVEKKISSSATLQIWITPNSSTAISTELSDTKTSHTILKQAWFKPVNKRKTVNMSHLFNHLYIHNKILHEICIRPGYQVLLFWHGAWLIKYLLPIGFSCLKDLITYLSLLL